MNNSLSRRDLVIRSAAVFAGAHLAGRTRLWAADARSKPGVQMFMVAGEFTKDPTGTLGKLAAIGYGYVEAFSMVIHNASEFRKMLADVGLECPSGHFAFGFEDTEKALDEASALGVHYAVSSVLPPEPPKNGDFMASIERLNRLTAEDFRRMAAL